MTTDIYSTVENDAVSLLKAQAGLGAVKTFEADLRECLFAGDRLTQGFRPDELPAINVTADRQPVRSAPFSAGEMGYTMTVTVVIVVKAAVKGEARAAARRLAEVVEALLHDARRSSNGFGAGVVVTGDVTSDVAVIEEKPLHFAIAEVAAQVLKVVAI